MEQVLRKVSKKHKMKMYGTTATMMGHLSVAQTFQEGLYTPERHLFYLAMETFIYEKRKSIRMLSAYAEPFYLPTDKNQYTEDIKKEDSDQNNDIENKTDIKNDKASQIKTPLSTKENKSIQETNKVIEEDWVQVKRNARTKVVRKAIQEAYIKNVKNRYEAMKVDEEVVDEKEDNKKILMSKEAPVEKCINYNVNNITVNKMVQHINEYKEKDDKDNAHEKTMNKKKNNSMYYIKSSKPSFDTQKEKEENIVVDSDSESDKENDDNESSIDDDDSMTDNDDSVDSFTIEDLNEKKRLYFKRLKDAVESTMVSTGDLKVPVTSDNENKTSKSDLEIERILYQNEILLVWLEQAELNEDAIRKENERNEERLRNENKKLLRENEANDSQNKHKISYLEKALKKKMELLIAALKEKG